MGLPRFVGVHPHSGIRLHHARASAGLERIALTIMSSGGPLDLSLLVGIHGSEGTDGRRFVRLHVIDFRLEFDLPRFHPLRLSYSKEHYHCAQDGPQEKSSTLLGPLWRLHFWRAVKSWSVRRIALCRPSCRTKTTKSCVQNSDSSSTERFLLVVINLVL